MDLYLHRGFGYGVSVSRYSVALVWNGRVFTVTRLFVEGSNAFQPGWHWRSSINVWRKTGRPIPR